MMVSESQLELMVLRRVTETKAAHGCWADPEALAYELGIEAVYATLGENREGMARDEVIVIDLQSGTEERRRFTWYHEITHFLIRTYDEIYSILHEQYVRDEDFTRIRERLSDIGAAEFLMPRDLLRSLFAQYRYSLTCLEAAGEMTGASRTALCVQLARLAPHRCSAVVCRPRLLESLQNQRLFSNQGQQLALQVALSMSSRTMNYPIASGAIIPQNHILHEAWQMENGVLVSGDAPLLLRYQTNWVVQCEGVRLGSCVQNLL
jgi:hypothetical protein